MPALTLVLLDNDGGGIFNFLAYQNELGEALFERGFATPQRASVVAVAAALGWAVEEDDHPVGLLDALARTAGNDGISVVVVRTARQENVTVHEAINAAIVVAVERSLGAG